LCIGPFVGTSLYVDASGITGPGTVLAKRETIKHDVTGSWVRTMNIQVRYQPHDQRSAEVSDIDVDAAVYDALHVGSPIMVKYAPSRLLRGSLILPAQRLVGQSTLTWLRLQFNQATLRSVGLAAVGMVCFLFWLFTPVNGSLRWRALPLLAWGGMMALVVIRPALSPAPRVPRRTATATVKEIDRITVFSRRRSSHGASFTGRRDTDLLYPYDLVQFEWTPPGLDTPVEVVDGIDPGSIPGLDVGSRVAISYPVPDPRAATLVGGTHKHQWINYLTLPVYAFVFFCLWLVWVLVKWIVGRRTARLRAHMAGVVT
jgi:hypothetical protein